MYCSFKYFLEAHFIVSMISAIHRMEFWGKFADKVSKKQFILVDTFLILYGGMNKRTYLFKSVKSAKYRSCLFMSSHTMKSFVGDYQTVC